MKVEIWHKADQKYQRAHTLDMYAVTDQALCELAYLHTKPGSVSQMQDPDFAGTQIGDIIVIEAAGDEPVRAYALRSLADCNLVLEKVDVPTTHPD